MPPDLTPRPPSCFATSRARSGSWLACSLWTSLPGRYFSSRNRHPMTKISSAISATDQAVRKMPFASAGTPPADSVCNRPAPNKSASNKQTHRLQPAAAIGFSNPQKPLCAIYSHQAGMPGLNVGQALALADSPCLPIVQCNLGEMRQRPVRRNQKSAGSVFRKGLKPIQRDGRCQLERLTGGSAQRGQMGTTTQGPANIHGQAANIRSLGAVHGQLKLFFTEAGQRQRMNGDGARLALNRFSLAGQLIEPLALVLERRVHGGYLLNGPAESVQHRLDFFGAEARHRPRFQHRSLGITAVGGNPQTNSGLVALVGLQQIPGHLGCLTKAQHQKA